MTPDQYCQDKAARSGSSFYYSFLFLPAEQRRAIVALYAFCREVDDAVDRVGDPGVARAKLDWWREEIGRLYAGRPLHPVTRALQPVIGRVNLAEEQFLEIIDGMAMDLDTRRYPDFTALSLYCYRVAGVVGLMSAEIFGYTRHETRKYAHHLGLAFQLTNIIRDVREDADRNRIYLPQDELQRFGVPESDILAHRETPAFLELMAFQAKRAYGYYDKALSLLPPEDARRQRTGLVMAAIYRATLDEVVADGLHVLTRRVRLTPLRKLWLALTARWRLRGALPHAA